jgi:hypothetical protein
MHPKKLKPQTLFRWMRTFDMNMTLLFQQLGLLKERSESEDMKESSPFKDILATMERPPDHLPPARSADYHSTKKSFFQNFTRKPSFKQLGRSSSDTTAPSGVEPRSPAHGKLTSPTHSPGAELAGVFWDNFPFNGTHNSANVFSTPIGLETAAGQELNMSGYLEIG